MLLNVLNLGRARCAVSLHPILGIIVVVNELTYHFLQLIHAGQVLNLAPVIPEWDVRHIDVDDDHSALDLFVKPSEELHHQILRVGIGGSHIGTVHRPPDSTTEITLTDEGEEITLDLLFRLDSAAHFTIPLNSCFNRLSAFNSAVVSTSL